MYKSLRNAIFLTLLLILISESTAFSQNQALKELFQNTHQVFALQRNSLGIYRDSNIFSGTDYHPASTANIGTGLIDLCIADAMAWETDAEEQVLQTLRSITGMNGAFQPDRNASGFYRHFLDMDTGEQAWNSEYSTIDSGILTVGALFAKNYYCSNDSIAYYADLLWNSIDWNKAIADVESGAIYREMLGNGSGKIGTEALPFNEYMLVAWLAMNQESNNEGPAHLLWAEHYSNTDNLPKKQFRGLELLADNPNYYLSHFVIQFCYFLCNAFTKDESYISYFENARLADSIWWSTETNGETYQWGMGAGSSPGDTSYAALSLSHNPYQIYSPHIIAGFIPVYTQGAGHLVQLYNSNDEPYALPTSDLEKILWRRSLRLPSWRAREVQGIDYASMLFGLASHPFFLGDTFFPKYNNFFDFECLVNDTTVPERKRDSDVLIFPNPFSSIVRLSCGDFGGEVEIRVITLKGQVVLRESNTITPNTSLEIQLEHLPAGIYQITVLLEGEVLVHKIVKS